MAEGLQIGELPQKENLTGNELIPFQQGSSNGSMSTATLKKYIGTGGGTGGSTDYMNYITEYNVSVQHPTSGIDGSNKYSLEGAIAQVPQELRNIGLKVSFINSDGKVETWEFQGGTFTSTGSWKQQSSGGNKILEWNTDTETTRKQITANERKPGMQVSYKNAEGKWINEQYIGTAVSDTEWAKDTNWEQIPNTKQAVEIEIEIPLLADSVVKVSAPYVGYVSKNNRTDYEEGVSSVQQLCKKGDVFTITGSSVGLKEKEPLYCLIADEDDKVRLVSKTNETAKEKEILVTCDGVLVINVKSDEPFKVTRKSTKSDAIRDCLAGIESLNNNVFQKVEELVIEQVNGYCYDLTKSVGESVSVSRVPSSEYYTASCIHKVFKGDLLEIKGWGVNGALWVLATLDSSHTVIAKNSIEDIYMNEYAAKVLVTQDCLLLYNSKTTYANAKRYIKRTPQNPTVTDVYILNENSDYQLNQAKACNLISHWCKGTLDEKEEVPIDENLWKDNPNRWLVSPYIDISEEDEYFINVDFTIDSGPFRCIDFYSGDKQRRLRYGYNTTAFSAYNPKVMDGWWAIPNMFPNSGVSAGKGMCRYFRMAVSVIEVGGNAFKDVIILKKTDFQRIYAGEINKLKKIPISTRRTDTFVGAINTMIDKILAKNPYSRFVFFNMYIPIPYLNRGVNTRWEAMTKAIDAVAKYWRTDCLKPDKLNLIKDDFHDLLNLYIKDNCHISTDTANAIFFVETKTGTEAAENGGNITINGGAWTKTISYEAGATVSDVLNKIAGAYASWDNEIFESKVVLKAKTQTSYSAYDEKPEIQNSEEFIVTFRRRESSPQRVAAMYRDFLKRQFLTDCNDKIIFHLGTSVPEGAADLYVDVSKINYPYYAAKALGMEYYGFSNSEVEYKGAGMYNLSKGGSCIRQYDFGKTENDDGGPKNPRVTSWLTPTSEGGELKNNIEVLEKKVLGTKLEPDLWVIDLSFNDMGYSLEWLLYDL